MATPPQKATNDGWTLVTRRRRPPHFLPSPQSPPKRTSPHNLRSPTYAQVVRSSPNSPPSNQDSSVRHTRLPQSPINLRYPPNPHFKEWWGRCFRCAKKGHVVAECPMPRPQPKSDAPVNLAEHQDPAWVGSNTPACSQTSKSSVPETKHLRAEPSFEEFLAQPEPQEDPFMPSVRPAKTVCYFNRDDDYFKTSQKLSSAIIIQPPENLGGSFSLDQAADLVAASNKVTTAQVQVGRLTKGRLLVVLPPEVNRDEIVTAMPRKVWDDGFVLQPYSPVMDASISIPFFKVWVDIKGIPLELYTEMHMARVVSSFGIYLGSLEPQVVGDCQTWTVFVATDDLAIIPYQVEVRVGGMVHTAQINPRKWTKGQVFHRSELPPTPIPYRPPGVETGSGHGGAPPPPVDPRWLQQGDDVIPMSLKALREIFRNFSPDELPADLAACLAGDERAIIANHEAYRRWEGNEERRAVGGTIRTTQEPTRIAAEDPQNLNLGQSAMQQPTQDPPMLGAHGRLTPSSDATANPPTVVTTVRRTDQGENRGKRVLTDPAL